MSTVGALVRSAHPVPSLAVAAISMLLGLGIGLDAPRTALLGVAILLQQFSVGLSNDWLDVERDRRVGRTDKPIASGAVSVPTARAASYTLAGLSLAATVPLGWWASAAHLGFLAAGWGYNLGLKKSWASVVPYAVGFGLLPFVVTLALPEPRLPAVWAVAVGVLLGVSAHFANALPDVDDDRRTGVRGLPHLVGHRASVAVTALSLMLGGLLVVFGPGSLDGPRLVALVLLGLLAVTCLWLGLARPPSRLLFRLILAAALLAVGLLSLSGRLLLA